MKVVCIPSNLLCLSSCTLHPNLKLSALENINLHNKFQIGPLSSKEFHAEAPCAVLDNHTALGPYPFAFSISICRRFKFVLHSKTTL